MGSPARIKTLDFSISPLQKISTEKVKRAIEQKVRSAEPLGIVGELAVQICLIQNTISPSIKKPLIAIFMGDHGIYNELQTNDYVESTRQEVNRVLKGVAPVNIFSQQNGLIIKLIDSGTSFSLEHEKHVIDAKIRAGTDNFMTKPAMTLQECRMAMDMAASLIDEFYDQGTNIIGFAGIGAGNACSASAIMHVLTGYDINVCTGHPHRSKDEIQHRSLLINLAVARHKVCPDDPIEVLRVFGGYELAMLTGAMLKAAELRMVILVDNFVPSVAALLADALYESFMDYCIFTQVSDELGHLSLLNYLGVEPILHLRMSGNAGSGVALGYPMVKAAVELLK